MNNQNSRHTNPVFLGCTKDASAIPYIVEQSKHSKNDPVTIWNKLHSEGRIFPNPDLPLKLSDNRKIKKFYQSPRFVFFADSLKNSCSEQLSAVYPHAFYHIDRYNLDINKFIQVLKAPNFINMNVEIDKNWKNLQKSITDFLELCSQENIPLSEIETILPRFSFSSFLFSMSFSDLQDFLDNQLCEKASPELREFAWTVYELMKSEFPVLAKKLGAICWENRQMYCTESKSIYNSCRFGNGFRPHKSELIDFLNNQRPHIGSSFNSLT